MPNCPTLAEIISTASLAIALITAWLYTAGHSYAYTYLGRFHIPLLITEIPLAEILVYGGFAVEMNPWASLICTSVLTVLLWGIIRWAEILGRFVVGLSVIVLA